MARPAKWLWLNKKSISSTELSVRDGALRGERGERGSERFGCQALSLSLFPLLGERVGSEDGKFRPVIKRRLGGLSEIALRLR